MKKIGMFLLAVILAGFAFVSGPVSSEAACQKPDCLVSPGCCLARECAEWCELTGGGAPGCEGNGRGGCCYCGAPES